jgi:hypothetical protein
MKKLIKGVFDSGLQNFFTLVFEEKILQATLKWKEKDL